MGEEVEGEEALKELEEARRVREGRGEEMGGGKKRVMDVKCKWVRESEKRGESKCE